MHGARSGLCSGCSNGVPPISVSASIANFQPRSVDAPLRLLRHYKKGSFKTTVTPFSRNGWSVVRSASLAKESTSKTRPSPHLHKVPTWVNKVSPQTLQTPNAACVVPIVDCSTSVLLLPFESLSASLEHQPEFQLNASFLLSHWTGRQSWGHSSLILCLQTCLEANKQLPVWVFLIETVQTSVAWLC
jgi:hypothetical protein